jgi:putative transposase
LDAYKSLRTEPPESVLLTKFKAIKSRTQLSRLSKTLEKYGVYAETYYSWKEKLSTMGEDGLDYGMTKEHLKRIRELEKENKLLKQIVAEKELEGKLKDELLKKKYALQKKKNL